jgi:hypothetical protein
MPGPANKKAAKKRQQKKKRLEKAKAQAAGTPPPVIEEVLQGATTSVSTPLEISLPSDRAPTYEPADEQKSQHELQYNESVDEYAQQEAHPWVEPATLEPSDDFRDETESSAGAIGVYDDEYEEDQNERMLEVEEPCIYDPGNGPRVRNFVGFMKSPFAVSQETSFGPDLLRTASAGAIIPLLTRILPGEFATVSRNFIPWYK